MPRIDLTKTPLNPQDEKLRELVLHVAKASRKDEKFGAVKLNKILFYADFLSYLRRGRSITGQDYFALQEGPAPKHMYPIQQRMKDDGDIAIQETDIGLSRPRTRTVALREPNYSVLEAEEVALVDEIIEKFWKKSGTDLSKLSHKFAGWKIAMEQGEKTIIKYSMAQFDAENLVGWEPPAIPGDFIEYGRQFMLSENPQGA
jgi:uncharacterized phage-associated protein